tara:strand:- start:53 stop:229 length:177 start_codon:yes stop_codon:yes gene_type:complete
MIGGALWEKVVQCGARLKYIKNKCKLNTCKINDEKKDSNKPEIKQNKIRRNKYGFPII